MGFIPAVTNYFIFFFNRDTLIVQTGNDYSDSDRILSEYE